MSFSTTQHKRIESLRRAVPMGNQRAVFRRREDKNSKFWRLEGQKHLSSSAYPACCSFSVPLSLFFLSCADALSCPLKSWFFPPNFKTPKLTKKTHAWKADCFREQFCAWACVYVCVMMAQGQFGTSWSVSTSVPGVGGWNSEWLLSTNAERRQVILPGALLCPLNQKSVVRNSASKSGLTPWATSNWKNKSHATKEKNFLHKYSTMMLSVKEVL